MIQLGMQVEDVRGYLGVVAASPRGWQVAHPQGGWSHRSPRRTRGSGVRSLVGSPRGAGRPRLPVVESTPARGPLYLLFLLS